MMGIGGNIVASVQVGTHTKNEIGEMVSTWAEAQKVKGWLDLQSGDSKYSTYHAKLQESTHIFVADYVKLDQRVTAENSRMVINGKVYDILLIDNPMELCSQLEFYLRFTGGQ